MKTTRAFVAAFLATVIVVIAASVAIAQGMQSGMGPGMTGSGMMCPMMMRAGAGSGMMGSAMMQSGRESTMGALFGSKVAPLMNLSVEDVRGYLNSQIDRLKNKRLKVGEIKATDGKIAADIVTVDNSLVQRLTVDPHTGAIEYQD